jgi:hypothetical protein
MDVGAVDFPLDDSQLVRGAAKDNVPAVIDPVFDRDWRSVDASLDADEMVIGVASKSAARAYSLAIPNYHEVVNDAFDGSLLVTYCPLYSSGVVAERTVAASRRSSASPDSSGDRIS